LSLCYLPQHPVQTGWTMGVGSGHRFK
jgi:hypothetical protein